MAAPGKSDADRCRRPLCSGLPAAERRRRPPSSRWAYLGSQEPWPAVRTEAGVVRGRAEPAPVEAGPSLALADRPVARHPSAAWPKYGRPVLPRELPNPLHLRILRCNIARLLAVLALAVATGAAPRVGRCSRQADLGRRTAARPAHRGSGQPRAGAAAAVKRGCDLAVAARARMTNQEPRDAGQGHRCIWPDGATGRCNGGLEHKGRCISTAASATSGATRDRRSDETFFRCSADGNSGGNSAPSLSPA